MSAIYLGAKNRWMSPGSLGTTDSSSIRLLDDTIKAVLVGPGYTFNASHVFLASVTGRIATSAVVSGKSLVGNVFDASDTLFTSVSGGLSVRGVVLYKDTGAENTSPLIAFLDESDFLPLPTDGGNVLARWSDGGAKIFAL
jgi:hypothetical protein